MKNIHRFAFLFAIALAGCQGVQTNPTTAPNTSNSFKNNSWRGMHLDPVQFIAEEQGFSCLAPSGLDFSSDGSAVKKTLCFKTEQCQTTTRTIYLDAHSMLVTGTDESKMPKMKNCKVGFVKK